MASRAQRYRTKLSLAVPGDAARPEVMAALKTGSSALQTCLRAVGGGKVGSLVSDAIDKLNEASHLEKAGKGQNLSLADLEAADTKAMGKKAVGLMKEAMAIAKQLAKVLPKSRWTEAEAFLKRAMST